jgi:hypothetical protein
MTRCGLESRRAGYQCEASLLGQVFIALASAIFLLPCPFWATKTR